MISTPIAAPVIAATRLRGGNAASARGAASLAVQAVGTARECGCTGTIIVWLDSACYNAAVTGAVRGHGARFSVTVPVNSSIRAAIAAIGKDAWTAIRYPRAIWDDQLDCWISDAEVTETQYTAFASQQFLLARATAGDGRGDPPFQPVHLLIARRQGPDGDQDAAQVLDGLSPGQRVEQAVGEGRPGSQVPQDRGGGAVGQPARRRVRAFYIGESLVEGLKSRADPAGRISEQVAQPLTESAARAPACGEPARLPAARAAAPEAGARTQARRAQRLAGGSAADREGLPAAGAPRPPLLAGLAPRLAGDLGSLAGRGAPADPARQRPDGPAGRA